MKLVEKIINLFEETIIKSPLEVEFKLPRNIAVTYSAKISDDKRGYQVVIEVFIETEKMMTKKDLKSINFYYARYDGRDKDSYFEETDLFSSKEEAHKQAIIKAKEFISSLDK